MLDDRTNKLTFLLLFWAILGPTCGDTPARERETDAMVQAGMVFTVSESKRLIAKAVAEMPIVKAALRNGKVLVAKGTTNTYIAEELLGRSIRPGAFVIGRITPQKGATPLPEVASLPEVVLVKGKHEPQWSLIEALQKLEPGDVVIKGANALDYQNKTAAVMIGAPDGGTTGKIMPYVVAEGALDHRRGACEKQISSEVLRTHLEMRAPLKSLNEIPSMFLLTGHIVTELEALKILAGVEAFQAAAGGIGGAEGGVWLSGPPTTVPWIASCCQQSNAPCDRVCKLHQIGWSR